MRAHEKLGIIVGLGGIGISAIGSIARTDFLLIIGSLYLCTAFLLLGLGQVVYALIVEVRGLASELERLKRS